MVAEVLNGKLKPYEGKTVAEIAAAEKKDPRDVVIDIVIADRANASCIISIMDENDVRTALASPARLLRHGLAGQGDGRAALARDVAPARLGLGLADPRLLRARGEGPAPRGGRPQDDVVRRGGGRPPGPRPHQAGASGRTSSSSTRRPCASRATFEKPNQYSDGIPYVAVNGVLVVDGGKITGATPGKALRGPGHGKF